MRRDKVVQARVNAAEKELVRLAVRAAGFDSESEAMRRLMLTWAHRVLEQVVASGPRVDVDAETVLAEFRAVSDESNQKVKADA